MENKITSELEKEVKKAVSNPFAKAFAAPLRLLMVKIKTFDEGFDLVKKIVQDIKELSSRLDEVEDHIKH